MSDENETIFYKYTRAQALEDGFQVDVTPAAVEAGFRYPVFFTRTVFDKCVMFPKGVEGQDEVGRLWDVLAVLRFAVKKSKGIESPLKFSLHVRNDNRASELVTLEAVCGPFDIDDPRPAITVMMPGED